MQIWDTAGQERFQSVQGVFYKGSDACMLVYDITSASSFQGINKWKDEFLLHANVINPDTFPFVLIGNKSDLNGERKVAEAKALQWCKENGNIPYYETSAKTAAKVNDAFEELAKKAIESRSIKLYVWAGVNRGSDVGGRVTKKDIAAETKKLVSPNKTKNSANGCKC